MAERTQPSLVVKSYSFVIKQLVEHLLLLEHSDVAAEAIPIEVLPVLRSVENVSESDHQQAQKLHAVALYLASFSNFVLKKRKSNRQLVIPVVPDMGLFQASRVLIISSSTSPSIARDLKQQGFDTLEMTGIKPALRALLHSTMFGACIFESCDVERIEYSKLDSDLQEFVGNGGSVFGFGPEFVELCNRVFFSKWRVEDTDAREVDLALHIVPSHPFFQPLVFESQLQPSFRLRTQLINNVAESECLYEAGQGALVFSSPLSMLAKMARHPKYSTRSSFAVGAYGSGNFCYCGSRSSDLSTDPRIVLPLRCILSLSLSNPPATLVRVPELPSSMVQAVIWQEEKYDYDDTDDEEGIPLIEALTNFARLRDPAFKPHVRDEQVRVDVAPIAIPDASPFDWLCRCFL